MKYTQVNISEIEKIYTSLAVADSINRHVLNGSDEGMLLFCKQLAKNILTLTPPNPDDYSDDLFKLELCHSIEEVSKQPDNIKMFGKPWFSEANVMLKILNTFEDV